MKKLYREFTKDPLYKNSVFMMISTFIMAASGFIFWIFIAKMFSPENIGIATALISLMTLINGFTHLGLNVGLIHYLPRSKQRNDMINSANLLVIIASCVTTTLVLIGLKFISPNLLFLQKNALYILSFTLFMIGSALNFIVEGIFVAYRATGNILIKNIILSIVKLITPVFLLSLGAYGIFTAQSLAILFSVIISIGILIFRYDFKPAVRFNKDIIQQIAAFSGGNYIADFLLQAATLILPLIIINELHAKNAAFYYIDSMILNLLVIIPMATTNSLLAEGAYNVHLLRKNVGKAVKIIFSLLIPSVAMIYFFGNIILQFFGRTFEAEAFQFLQLLSLSAIFIAITYISIAILRVKNHVRAVLVISFLGSLITVSLSYKLIAYGLTGIGYGWLLGQATLAGIFVVYISKKFSSSESILFFKKATVNLN